MGTLRADAMAAEQGVTRTHSHREGQALAAAPSDALEAPGSTTIVIPNYNGLDDLPRLLTSLRSEADGAPPQEIVLVDNASMDRSVDYIRHAFPEVRVIQNATNEGFGAAANLGARAATGEYLVFLNPDVDVAPGWLQPLVAALNAHPEVALVTPKILLMQDPERINACGIDIHCTGLALCRGMGQDAAAFAQEETVGAISGAAFMVRRRLFEALGGFDPSFFLYMEDTDLSWRARLAGYETLFVPASIVYHDYTLRFGPLKTFYQERNRYLMLLKTLHWRSLLVWLPLLLLGEIITWGYMLRRDRQHLDNKLRAYAWIVRHRREIMRSRRGAQAQRRIGDRELLSLSLSRLAYEQAEPGPIARFCHRVWDPVFAALRWLALMLIM
jgi:GT2 family glycosyltransferase